MTEPQADSVTKISWPALLRHADEAELTVVSDQNEWNLDPDLHARPYHPDARLVDSDGCEYRLVFAGSPGQGRAALVPTGQRSTDQEVRRWAEAHLKAAGAQAEWLAAYLSDMPTSAHIRATILYLSRHGGDTPAPDEDEEA